MKSVYIIILNWNRKEETLECLESVRLLAIKDFKLMVVVVDNASADGSARLIQEWIKKGSRKAQDCEFMLIQNSSNLGFAAGNNVGINFAIHEGADYVCLLNNDTKVDPGLVAELVSAAENKKRGGAFSPKIYFMSGYEFHKDRYKKSELGKVFWAAGGAIDWANVFGINRGVDEVDRGQYEKVEKQEFATGACVLYRVNALVKSGVFDERYFMYFEDLDLSVRLSNKGWNIYYTPKARLWHKVAQSSGIGGELNDYFISRNRMLFGLKYASIRTKAALIRESIRLIRSGRKWQKLGISDFYKGNFGKGSWRHNEA